MQVKFKSIASSLFDKNNQKAEIVPDIDLVMKE